MNEILYKQNLYECFSQLLSMFGRREGGRNEKEEICGNIGTAPICIV